MSGSATDAKSDDSERVRCYEGSFKDGIPHGKGKFTCDDGTIYEGNHKDGIPHGKGKFTCQDGRICEGNFNVERIDGKVSIEGDGKIALPSGEIYEGYFKDGKRQGKGKLTFNNGAIFEGYFKNDEPYGIGKLTDADGTIYEGASVADNTIIVGIYEGDYKDGQPHGKGKLTYPDKSTYMGNWKDGKLHGKGKHTMSDGTFYEGIFKNGERHVAEVVVAKTESRKRKAAGNTPQKDKAILKQEQVNNTPDDKKCESACGKTIKCNPPTSNSRTYDDSIYRKKLANYYKTHPEQREQKDKDKKEGKRKKRRTGN